MKSLAIIMITINSIATGVLLSQGEWVWAAVGLIGNIIWTLNYYQALKREQKNVALKKVG